MTTYDEHTAPVSVQSYPEGVIFPFRQTNWPAKLWWVALVNFVPILNLILLRGWRLNIVRRMGRREPELLPDIQGIGRYLVDGLVLWFMSAVYFIPQLVLLSVLGADIVGDILTILLWVYENLFTDEETITFVALFVDVGFGFLVRAILPAIYFFLSWPFYRAAMIRYSVRGNPLVFFDFVTNARIVFGNLSSILLVFFLFLVTGTLVSFLSGVLVATVVGSFVVLMVLLPMAYWVTGYLYGRLAMDVLTHEGKLRKKYQPAD
jgi:hypothetical protein